jgi:hypothetical protein
MKTLRAIVSPSSRRGQFAQLFIVCIVAQWVGAVSRLEGIILFVAGVAFIEWGSSGNLNAPRAA